MRKVLILLAATLCLGSDFKNSCVECHQSDKAPGLENIYYRYLMLHSSRDRIAKKMYEFLSNSKEELSSMPKGMIENFGMHPKIETNNLKSLIDEYINEYRKKTEITFE